MTQQEKLEAILKDLKGDIISAHNNNYGENIWNAEDFAMKQATQAITALIQEAERKVQVRCAAEMSILDQEIQSLKAQIQEARIDEVRRLPYISDPLDLEAYCNKRLQELSRGSNNE